MKIIFFTNIPSPYRVSFFNKLGEKSQLSVCFERHNAKNRNSRWNSVVALNYKEYFIKAIPIGIDKSFGIGFIRIIQTQPFDYLIIGGYSSPSVMLAISYCRLRKIPYIIESDGGFCKKDGRIKGVLKKFFLSGANAHFTTCDEHIRYLMSVGIASDRIIKYPFSSLCETDIARDVATKEEKKRIKDELGIREGKVVLSVGQFIHRKGFDVLINAATKFPEDVGVYIIGGVPTSDFVELREKRGLSHLYFIDFKEKSELKKWYRASDVFVFPTREDIWGLVINEAMAQGLPVVTTNRCIAGKELVDEKYLVPVDDEEAIVAISNNLLMDEECRIEVAKRNLRVISEYTIENSAFVHLRYLGEQLY